MPMRARWFRAWCVAFVAGASVLGSPAWGQAAFTEEAAARGVVFFTPYGTSAGRGMAFADLDNDGDPDLVCLGGPNNVLGVFENDGTGRFTDRRSGSGLAATANNSCIVVADYDADGDLDIYIARWGEANRLYRNNGGFSFTNVTAAAGVGNMGHATGCAWGDYDGDGWLDLYVSNMRSSFSPTPNALYRNRGDGTFEDVGPQLGVVLVTGLTWQAAFFDYDRDGDADLYINDDKGVGEPNCARHNFQFRNDGGTFSDVTGVCRTAACIDAMGLAIGDVNNDRFPDMYITNTPSGNIMYISEGGEFFREEGLVRGVRSYATGWGTLFFDYDHDGDVDLYVCNQDAPNRLYRNESVGAWPEVAAAMGVDRPSPEGFDSYVAASADVDMDGDLDLAVQSLNAPVRLYINNEGAARTWVKFRVAGEPGSANTFAYGARVEVWSGGRWQAREVLGQGGFKSHNDTVLHFGLGTAATVDEVRVVWPGGTTRTLSAYSPNRLWTVRAPAALGDMNTDGTVASADLFAFLECFFLSPDDMTDACAAGDMDGDGRLSSVDFFHLVRRLFE